MPNTAARFRRIDASFSTAKRFVSLGAAALSSHIAIPNALADRAALVIPDNVWAEIEEQLGLEGRDMGHDPFNMQRFGRDDYMMRSVLQQFVSVRDTLRFSGNATDLLLDNAAHPDELIRHAFAEFLDEGIGRRVRIPGMDSRGISGELPDAFDPEQEDGSWGVDWLLDDDGNDLPTQRAAATALARASVSSNDVAWIDDGKGLSLKDGARAEFERLPEQAQRLIVRLLIAIAESRTHHERSIRKADLFTAIGDAGTDAGAARAALAVRVGNEGAPLPKSLYDVTGQTDLGPLGLASVELSKRVRLALDEFERTEGPQAVRTADLDGFELVLATYSGDVVIGGTGPNRFTSNKRNAPLLALDFGGDDAYTGTFATGNAGAQRPVALLIDLGGSDTYAPTPLETREDGAIPLPTVWDGFSLATGVFGIGMLFDLGAGDDSYTAHAASMGAGFHGVGLLYDDGGDDTYNTLGSYGQGVAHVGLGALIDLAGDDTYTSGTRSQAHGSTRGAGVIVDVAGNDSYTIRDDAEPSALYLGRTVAMGQGCGYGRRADLGDGESMAGGFGVLVDGAGDDAYSAMAWSQGCAYWWGVGILEDRAGNDTYRQGKYSQGAGAHFGVGVFVDLKGDDRYNTSRDRMTNRFTGEEQYVAENQYAGHGRDGSIGICVDGGGDDVHVLRANCAGNADLNSIALFWDRSGNDRYLGLDIATEPGNPDWERPPLGTTTHYREPFRSFRDDMWTLGVFLDTGGDDIYEGVVTPAKDNTTWAEQQSESERAVGIDTEQ